MLRGSSRPLHMLMACAGICALAAIAYWNTFDVPFVFDDIPCIVEKELLRDLSVFLRGGDARGAFGNRWVAYLTFALNQRWGGLAVAGYHAVNLVIHAANALLVYALVALTFTAPRLAASALTRWRHGVAFCAAVVFVAHPIQTQAVTYVVQRMTSLATTFYLGAVVLYVWWRIHRGEPAPRRAFAYVGALLSAFLAVRTKEIAFTLPLALVLYELVFLERSSRRAWLAVAPFAALALFIPASLVPRTANVRQILSAADGATRVLTSMSRMEYARTEIPVVLRYLRLFLVPVGQNVDHDVPLARSWLEPRVVVAALALGLLAGSALWLVRRSRAMPGRLDPAAAVVGFGMAWFFLTLSVESSFVPITDVIFEHRVYLPSVGLAAALAVGCGLWAVRRARPGRALLGLTAVLAVVLAFATARRNAVWADAVTLWTDTVAKSPNKTRPHTLLGLALSDAGRHDEAVAQFREVIRLDPVRPDAYVNMASGLEALGRQAEAVEAFWTAVRLGGADADAYYGLGRIALASGDPERARELLEKALAARRGDARTYANLGAALNLLRRYAETVALLRGAGAAIDRSPEAHFNLAIACAATGDRDCASRELAALRSASSPFAAQLQAYLSR